MTPFHIFWKDNWRELIQWYEFFYLRHSYLRWISLQVVSRTTYFWLQGLKVLNVLEYLISCCKRLQIFRAKNKTNLASYLIESESYLLFVSLEKYFVVNCNHNFFLEKLHWKYIMRKPLSIFAFVSCKVCSISIVYCGRVTFINKILEKWWLVVVCPNKRPPTHFFKRIFQPSSPDLPLLLGSSPRKPFAGKILIK